MKSEFLIKEIMDKKRLTIQDLSETVNIDKEKLTDFLNGENKLSLEEYGKIGAYFNLSLDTLVTGIPTKQDERKIRKSEIFRLQNVGVLKKFIKYISIRGIGMLMFFALFNLIIGMLFYGELYKIRDNMYMMFDNPNYDGALSSQMYSLQMIAMFMIIATAILVFVIIIDIILFFVYYKDNNITDKSIEK